jgi:integrase
MLRKMLVVAVEWQLLDHVPAFKWLKVPEQKFDFLDFDEAKRLQDKAVGLWQVMVALGLKTGLRQGELIGLRWEDVDLVAQKLMVRQAVARGIIGTPKNGKTREVPLSDQTVQLLKAHRHLKSEFVFCDDKGRMLTKGACKWPLWSTCKRAGLRRIGWHVLRHTFASHLVMKGVPLKAVQELLGHSTIEMTMRYAHLARAVHQEAIAKLDQTTESRHQAGIMDKNEGSKAVSS